jgi:DNA-binding response OmpR family regulator
VDDEPVVASTLGAIIRMSGFEVRVFTRSREAFETALLLAPDILLSDVMMPEMNGVELAIQISLLCPGCKILLLSGQASTIDLLHEAHKVGNDFELLLKPLNPEEVVEKVRRLFLTSPSPAMGP